MKNVHLLPTDKPSRLSYVICTEKSTLTLFEDEMEKGKRFFPQNIYITSSDEGIKEGDWFIHPDSSCFDKEWKEVSIGGYEILQVIKVDENFIYHSSIMAIHKNFNIKKIILTTDPTLILYGVQPIDDEFLNWFVKNPSCEFVKIGLHQEPLGEVFNGKNYNTMWTDPKYQIMIPKEELKHPKVFSENGNELFFDEQGNLIREQLDYTALLQPVGTRQETLEEANWKVLGTKTDSFYNGAKWMEERMYSEEECYKYLHSLMTDIELKGLKINDDTDLKQWFEQFKKK